jgi:hypothetical protein
MKKRLRRSTLLLEHIFQFYLKSSGADANFIQRKNKRQHQQPEAETENDVSPYFVLDVKKQHTENTAKETQDSAGLHALDEDESAFQIFDLLLDQLFIAPFFALFVLRMEISNQRCQRKKPVSVGQHQQCDCREKQRRSVDGNLHAISVNVVTVELILKPRM